MLQSLHLYALFFFFFLLLSFPKYSQASTTDDERAILLSLKQHWGNPSSLDQCNSTSSPCHCPYISCIAGSVTEISLPGVYIGGSFPSTIICQLNNLTSINLNTSSLSGTIPPGLSTCSKLQTLDLSANHLTGRIPGELFSMKTLSSLSLAQNMLSGEIPTPMVAYSLELLNLSSNHLNGSIPEDVGNLYNLGYLDLSWNSLITGPIPATLLRLHQLCHLSLASNNLTGEIPGELFSMKKLHHLDLHQNMLFGEIPAPMVASRLEFLDLSSNHLNGSIPEHVGNLYNLDYLDLSRNSFSGLIPEDVGNLYHLVYLDLSRNSFSGPIPARLLLLYRLSNLSLASNNLTGEIPANLDLFSLRQIDLSHNHLSGTIPARFGELRYLEDFDITDNQFSGDICETVSNMWATQSINLWFCSNKFSGRIPYDMENTEYTHTNSCFDKANLCPDVLMHKGLPECSSYRCSKPNTSKKVTITCVVIAAVVLIGLGVLILVFRRMVGKRKEDDDGEEWSLISFQRLEFNKWEILGGLTDENLIGNGGSGKVYRVITRQGQRVAVKSIRHEQKQGQGLMEKQFLAEVKILGGIWHNNIVKLLCCIRGRTTKLIVYEYMDKQCLHKWLHGKNRGLTTQVLQWERRLKIAIGAAQGLCYMHHNCRPPIVHRDIKSSNILVDSEFNAKIADFGLAKMLASEEDPETASAIVGTFGYIAPEYGSTRKVNVKSDIYSFGVVLLELTTGREAVSANEDMNLAQWAHNHLREGNSAADAMDEEMKDPRYLEAATTVFKLGLACTLSSPSSRPSMKDVLQILQRCSENNNHLSSES